MSDEFLAQTLNSRQLLALLFVCECKRKGVPLSEEAFKKQRPGTWDELLNIFATRLANLAETMRFEVLEAHLMSVEDIDVYNNETLGEVLQENKKILDYLSGELDHDSRFQLEAK
jgi:hypothetical protein